MDKLITDRVSLLIPIYNGQQYIERCLNSVISQTYRDIQLILVNDGSTDDTEKVLMDYLPKLKKSISDVLYVKQENGGSGSAINEGLKYFNGEYLMILDIDDFLFENAIESLKKQLSKNKNISFVYGNGYYVNENNLNDISNPFYYPDYISNDKDLFISALDRKLKSWAGSYMIRSSTWLKNNKGRDIFPSRYGQNMQLVLPALFKSEGMFINVPIMKYIRHSESLTFSLTSADNKNDNYEIEKKRYFGYEEIFIRVIDKLDIENKEQYDKYLKYVKSTFLKERMRLAIKYSKDEDGSCFNELKYLGMADVNDKIDYFYRNNKIIYVVYRILRKLRLSK